MTARATDDAAGTAVIVLDEVEVGLELPELVIESVDAEKMKLMAALLRDPNPIHFDAEQVRALGMGDRPVNQGPTNLSYLLDMVTRWSGGVPTLHHVAVRFLGNVFAGDRVVCTGRVVEVAGGAVTLEVRASVDDRPVLDGLVVVAA
ncbi:MAG: protein dehydratase [Conexibacter sp.]|nr:protein dehydratase [Conexibacter sp.]